MIDDLFTEYTPTEERLKESLEVETEPLIEEVISEDVVVETPPTQEPLSMMDDLSSKLSTFLNRTDNVVPEDTRTKQDVLIEHLSAEVAKIKRMVTENTLVSGIGQGGDGQLPGSGEVRINRMDDVNPDGLEDGNILVWDGSVGKWVPGRVDDGTIITVCDNIDGGNSRGGDRYNGVYSNYLDSISAFDEGTTDKPTDGGTADKICG